MINKVDKVWGHEEWIVNNDLYCGKKLVVNRKGRMSMHCHKEKTETFYCAYGCVLLEYGVFSPVPIKKEVIMWPGDVKDIPKNTYHRVIGIAPVSELIEFSTHHEDADSYRLTESDIMPDSEFQALLSKL